MELTNCLPYSAVEKSRARFLVIQGGPFARHQQPEQEDYWGRCLQQLPSPFLYQPPTS